MRQNDIICARLGGGELMTFPREQFEQFYIQKPLKRSGFLFLTGEILGKK